MLELRHLNTLLAIREAGSLVEAAERLHVTQSALSHQLKDLEHRLGVALIVRRTRPIRFTPAGQRVLELARQVLPRVRRTETELRRLAAGRSGRLHIAIECHSCFQWLMPALDRFREGWPEVELDLSAAFSFTPQSALVRGDLDMVITSDPVDDEAVRYLPLFRYELVLAVARDSALARPGFVSAGDLADQVLIAYPVEHERLDVFTAFLDPAGVAPASVRTAELTPMMVQLVAAGRGVAALPNWALTEYLDLKLVEAARLGEAGVWRTLYAAVRDGDESVPFIQEFMETARELCFQNLSGIKRAG
ncbi:transcriptional activator MetR [Alcanivorax sp. 521-1]|uniref:HTH-type transcriptional regulator MetR n=1 Tax=Alloalcanivorax profundimaris TaxID=2735259 RepID=A0ABS0ASK2_9GAMM|nr:LysR family transcriptional regulator [Alloalcanivorax profundimaris]MAO58746.1 LysR family transcriptional regulator [Alcanivorax sp.]MCQ6263294.1 LysR substrate-binding domain-containing protein [Alcanivorax sp. MM125-6]QJX03179.1 LysR family transcriptional regulator [Alcanivorax sp. IO_7]UWN51632.1 HTH-type transcriptional regulator BenM [Alcanivorax sp. ALC70]MBF5056245.1 transcriptional activator MetR [Alloalcanivorax profundimaris]|tara:strand:+ start:18422 stop:19339 length:918 start_codon:yes stop_codon:yes gene_type:complete